MNLLGMVQEHVAATPNHHFDISGGFGGSVVGESFFFEVSYYHVEDCVTMQLLPKDIHGAVRHTGGAAIILSGGNITVDAATENNDDGD